MRKRDRTGLAMGPLFLRLLLAVTFLWAGLGKFMARIEVQGEPAAILANYGVLPNPNAPRDIRPPADEPEEASPEEPPIDEAAPDDGGGEARAGDGDRGRVVLTGWQGEGTALATAADFPEPVQVRRWAGLVLALHGAIHPGLRDEDSTPQMQLWPDVDSQTDFDPWPVRFALAVAVTELVAGVLLAIGLLTRLSALSVAGVMVGAMWLTVIGPAIQSGDTTMGFLPAHDTFDTEAWTKPLWQFALFCGSMSLVFTGPGTLSLDRLLLGGPPKGPAPKPAQPPQKK